MTSMILKLPLTCDALLHHQKKKIWQHFLKVTKYILKEVTRSKSNEILMVWTCNRYFKQGIFQTQAYNEKRKSVHDLAIDNICKGF
ncbi:CLUMA_CG016020, isoform A [Clunio marinus]|uniref:CLUMA_CG016020, isoform A n=1 Tax=Clunio marinus TaxID=568069 RepID=A0A1J1ITD1_9DIPT|nr:CLUMA_CG016020, isoform A [Clunio marinus]